MEAVLGKQGQNLRIQGWHSESSHSRRAKRWHRGESSISFHQFLHGASLGNDRTQDLSGIVLHPWIVARDRNPANKLDELKAQRFTAPRRRERIEQSLAALQEPGAIQLSAADWVWLDENSDVEDEIE